MVFLSKENNFLSQLTRAKKLLVKAESALISAMEVYNKPDFAYREETFAILSLNAWELLLKSKILSDNNNDPRSLYVYERRINKTGKKSKKKYLKKNRAGNIHTIGLRQAMTVIDSDATTRLPAAVRTNIDAITEIRDNAIHFINPNPELSKQILEIGTASIKNFLELARIWFDCDLSRYNLYILPIGFISSPGEATAVSLSPDEGNLMRYLHSLVAEGSGDGLLGFHVALEINLSFKRSSTDAVSTVSITTDPSAPKLILAEEDIRQKYPWGYVDLTDRLRERYVDFKANMNYHQIRKPLMNEPKYVNRRYLDPENPKSLKKDYYNPNIVEEFDKHYTRK